ncbi:hypothetical protein VTN00DRAFT_6614 [Thermoascus crustaceus]|uniref:uncharacterized protein n=1 Tax=Thermoascus crustaceus TaxID=5088 RepID=UPI0037426146
MADQQVSTTTTNGQTMTGNSNDIEKHEMDPEAISDSSNSSGPPNTSPPEPFHDQQTTEGAYSVYSVTQKKCIILAASFAAFFSPLSSSIYLPALSSITTDLHVSNSKINLTVTTYMIIQGLAPMLIAGFSDTAGRRPAYAICFTVYLLTNLGLALQNSYPALLVLRCLQSAGSSGTVALANGVVGDLITSSESGTYVAFASLGSILGPTLSPIIGGLLSEYLDWHWIFWFLVILTGAFCVPFFLFMPETCRRVVHDGSVPPPSLLNWSLTDVIRHGNRARAGLVVDAGRIQALREQRKIRIPNPLTTLVVFADKETALILLATGLAFGCTYAVLTGASSLFEYFYRFNDIQIALMFVPFGAGSTISAFTTGRLVDWNYRRHAKRCGVPVVRNRRQNLSRLPLERARLELGLPMFYTGCATVIAYGWTMNMAHHHHVSLAVPVILLFLLGYSLVAAFQVLNILMVDIYPGKPATATAANNLVRCEIGAAASAVIAPMVEAMGTGWSYTVLALIVVGFTPCLMVVMRYGMGWRQQEAEK